MTWRDKLKKHWNEHPLEVIMVASLAATAAAKLLDSMSSAKGRHAYAKQVDYRVRNHK